LYATYRREYEHFTHLPYDDHDRAVKLIHALDRIMWDGKVETILEFEKYTTLTVNELLSKLKSAVVDRGLTTCLKSPTDPHSIALVGGKVTKYNANASSTMYSLSFLMSLPDEEFDALEEDELALLTRRFERLHENRVNTRRIDGCAFSAASPDTSFLTAQRRRRTRTTTSTGRTRTTSTYQDAITSTRTSTRTSDDQGRRTAAAGKPE
jgi:hypothetical protein